MSVIEGQSKVAVRVGWTEYTGDYFPPLDGYRDDAARAWAELEFPLGVEGGDLVVAAQAVAELLFAATNLYAGPYWSLVQAHLPEDRGHTALSVGDVVQVGEVVLSCESLGWQDRTPAKAAGWLSRWPSS
jgi:hypothetical protein